MTVFAAPAAACDISSLEFAEQAIDANRLTQAQRMLGDMAGVCEDVERFRALAASLRLAQGNAPEARRRFERLAADFPDNSRYLSGAGRAALIEGDLAAALDWLLLATGRDDADWAAWNALAVLMDRQRRWEASALAYEQALALAPDEPVVWNNRGYSLILQRRGAEALPFLETARTLDPDSARISYNYELAAAMNGEYEFERRAGESRADWAARLNNAGYGAMITGDVEAAERLFSEAIEVSDVYFSRAAANRDSLPAQ